jgi:hypothetical protein
MQYLVYLIYAILVDLELYLAFREVRSDIYELSQGIEATEEFKAHGGGG